MSGKSYQSSLYKYEQERIRSSLKTLFEYVGDTVYLSLKSESEIEGMQRLAFSRLTSHNYTSPDNSSSERSLEGIREKLKINGRHKESKLLADIWAFVSSSHGSELDQRALTLSSDISIPHRMIKLMVLLANSPSQPGKSSDVAYFPSLYVDSGSVAQQDGANVHIEGDESDDERIEKDLEALQEWKMECEEEEDEKFSDDEDEEYCDDRWVQVEKSNGYAQSVSVMQKDDSTPKVTVEVSWEDYEEDIWWSKSATLQYGVDLLHPSHAISYRHTTPSYSTSLLPELPTPLPPAVVCAEDAICREVLHMLCGATSEMFVPTHPQGEGSAESSVHVRFRLSPAASRASLLHMSSLALRSLLQWFIKLGNFAQSIRASLDCQSPFIISSVSERQSQDDNSPPALVEAQASVLQSVREIMERFDTHLAQLEMCLTRTPTITTLIGLHSTLRPWMKLLGSAAGLGRTAATMRGIAWEFAHQHTLSFLAQLQTDVDATQLILIHPEVLDSVSSYSSHPAEREINIHIPIYSSTHFAYAHLMRCALASLCGRYLEQMLGWVFSGGGADISDSESTNTVSSMKYRSRGAAISFDRYDISVSPPPLFTGIIQHAASSSSDAHILSKHHHGREHSRSTSRDFLSSAEKSISGWRHMTTVWESTQDFSSRMSSAVHDGTFDEKDIKIVNGDCVKYNSSGFIFGDSAPRTDVIARNLIRIGATLKSHRLTAESKPFVPPNTNGEARDCGRVSCRLLADIFPSCSVLMQHMVLRPLHATLECTQRQCVSLLNSDNIRMVDNLVFMQEVFLLSGATGIYEPLRAHLLLPPAASSAPPRRGRQSKFDETAVIIASSIEDNILGRFPGTFSSNLVSVSLPVTPRQTTSSAGGMLTQVINALSIEIHFPAPLVEILPGEAVGIYREQLRLLLHTQSGGWAAEIAWKKITSSKSSLLRFCSRVSSLAVGQFLNTCACGVQWMLHICQAVQSFYLRHIHDTLWVDLVKALARCSSVEELRNAHSSFLEGVQACSGFIRPLVDRFLNLSLGSIDNLNEAFSAAEASEAALNAMEWGGGEGSQSTDILIIRSRLSQATRGFSVMLDCIRDIVRTLDEISNEQRGPFRRSQEPFEHSSISGPSQFLLYTEQYFSSSLRALIGDVVRDRLIRVEESGN